MGGWGKVGWGGEEKEPGVLLTSPSRMQSARTTEGGSEGGAGRTIREAM